MKQCVYCQQTLVDMANVCHYCNRDQEEPTQECLWCKQRISFGVRVCHHCNQFTNKWVQFFQSWIIPILIPILTVFLVWFAALQVQEVRKERVSADLAAERAKNAQCSTINAGLETIDLIRGYLDDPTGKMMAVGSPEFRKKLKDSEINLKNKRQELSCTSP